jgi:hypothetical protein
MSWHAWHAASVVSFFTLLSVSLYIGRWWYTGIEWVTRNYVPFSGYSFVLIICVPIVRSSITGLKAIRGWSRILGFNHVRPIYSCPPLIATCGRLSLGPVSPFVCCLRVCLICRLALLHLNVPRPRLDCPASGLWSRGAVGLPTTASARFEFPLVPGAPPRPRLPRMLADHPPQHLDWIGIWSMKEFCNLN